VKVLFTGALFDSSGYAEASRNYVSALMLQPDIDLSLQTVSFETWVTDLPEFRKKVTPLINKKLSSVDTHIIHLTPENFVRFPRVAKRTIGMTVWETDRLPASWVAMCNNMDEIWVPCKWNVDVFKQSGVTVPVVCVPHCIDFTEFNDLESSSSIVSQIPQSREKDIVNELNVFNFYSIFQWSTRKNPEGLIRAYLSEFDATDNVNLVLKTYLGSNSTEDKQQIISLIKKVKSDCQLEKTPPITLLHGSLSRQEILTIHKSCDCFVLPHRSEGWGVPHFEAMASGKPVIATGYGGNTEFMNEFNSWLLPYNLSPVYGMGRPTYNAKAHWAEPNLQALQLSMREAFTDRGLLEQKSSYAQVTVSKFTVENIGELMLRTMNDKA
jgi:glycosyltransferase involved in cell wall biosynthesis